MPDQDLSPRIPAHRRRGWTARLTTHVPPEIRRVIDELAAAAGVRHADIVREVVATGLPIVRRRHRDARRRRGAATGDAAAAPITSSHGQN